jgi:hypothetical protein
LRRSTSNEDGLESNQPLEVRTISCGVGFDFKHFGSPNNSIGRGYNSTSNFAAKVGPVRTTPEIGILEILRRKREQ